MHFPAASSARPFHCIPAITAFAHPCAADGIMPSLRHTWMYKCRERHDCMDAGGRATHGAVAEDAGSDHGRIHGVCRKKHPGILSALDIQISYADIGIIFVFTQPVPAFEPPHLSSPDNVILDFYQFVDLNRGFMCPKSGINPTYRMTACSVN